jgi:transcriptional regulator with XRE-family HTH domain
VNEEPVVSEQVEDPDDSTELFRLVGKQIKLLRERKGMTQRQLAEAIGYSEDLVSSVERGRRIPQPEFLVAVDKELDAGGLLVVTTEEIAKAKAKALTRHPAWFRMFASLETQSAARDEFSPDFIPGLLQTEAHARALFSMRKPVVPEETIDKWTRLRMARQELLEGAMIPECTWVIEEAVLHRPIGGREVHRGQLQKLLRMGGRRGVELQVLPMSSAEFTGMTGPFILLTPKNGLRVGYLEVQTVNHLTRHPEEVRNLALKYGNLRAHALTPQESLALIEKMLGEL